ncbi:phenylalanine--tRNA ligase subunit beta [Candidatus Uhrbacteria bacterium]|nr:phenylalanine--tRNA ligase subunit beta [Candidatus Uhrbacteria bacterium]
MLLVKDWLLEFVSLPKTATDEEIARRLSLSTVEVEGVRSGGGLQDWHDIVVGEILTIEPHPNADRLRIAHVHCGNKKKPLSIICGGSNLAVGMKVAVALPGARVRWHGQGDPILLEKTAIRGVESDGMICASAEISLADVFPSCAEHEILDLSALAAPAGTSLEKALPAHTVFEIDNKSLSHRSDLWGHRGMARECAALFAAPFHDKKMPALPGGTGRSLTVTVSDADLCSRYIGLAVDGVSYMSSPGWMQERLSAAGVRPISALVDITNYVMLEYGQPMHAFDFDAIAEKENAHIIVRRAQEGESIRALDGGEYVLSSDSLIVANQSGPIAIAGVMGGLTSGVTESTTTVVFEAAHFAPASIRRTATKLGLVSESSRRFEKDLDPELPRLAMARCLQLCAKIFPQSRVSSAVRDVFRPRPQSRPIVLTREYIERRLGIAFPLGRMVTLLKRLGFGVRAGRQSIAVDVPSFRRKDVMLPEDILEEILRLAGYETVPSALPRVALSVSHPDTLRAVCRDIRHHLSLRFAFHETYTYAFSRPQTVRAVGHSVDDYVKLANPLSEERPLLCRSLIPNLLEVLERNQQKEKRHAYFEINRVFLKESSYPSIPSDHSPVVPHQPLLWAFVFGSRDDAKRFAFCTDAMKATLSFLGWNAQLGKVSSLSLFYPNRSAVIMVNGVGVGAIGEIARATRTQLGIDEPTVACEIDLSLLAKQSRDVLRYVQPSEFPASFRNVTFVIDERHSYDAIARALACAHPLISVFEPRAIFRDEKKVGKNKKCLSFHITYQARDRTLTSEEADRAHASVVDALAKKFSAAIRS